MLYERHSYHFLPRNTVFCHAGKFSPNSPEFSRFPRTAGRSKSIGTFLVWLVLKKGSGQAGANQLCQLGALIFLEFDLFARKDFETCKTETLVPLQKRLVMTVVVS